MDSLKLEINSHILFYCALFHLGDTVFHKLMVCGNPVSNKSVGTIFPTALTYFVSLKFDNFYNFSCLFVIFIIVICDFFFMFLFQKDYGSLKAQF